MTTPLRSVPPVADDRTEPLLREVFGDVLRRVRAARGLTLRDVAEDAQVSLAYVSEVERGQKEASSEILGAVCRALDITMLELVSAASRELEVREVASMPLTMPVSIPGSDGAALAMAA